MSEREKDTYSISDANNVELVTTGAPILSVHATGQPILVIHMDGRVEFPGGMPDDERARRFFALLEETGVSVHAVGWEAGMREAAKIVDDCLPPGEIDSWNDGWMCGIEAASDAILSAIGTQEDGQ